MYVYIYLGNYEQNLSSWLCLNLAKFFQIISIKIMSGVDEMYMENLDEWIFEENKVPYSICPL
jgi:hypothetical protein